jgi:hypothetical protein
MARDRFARFGDSATDLSAAAAERLDDALILPANNRFASAIAMGLYSLEISLKAKICSRLTHRPKPFEIHDFDELLLLAGLSRRLDDPAAMRGKSNWVAIVTGQAQHVNDLRYLPSTHVNGLQAQLLLQQLRDPPGRSADMASQPTMKQIARRVRDALRSYGVVCGSGYAAPSRSTRAASTKLRLTMRRSPERDELRAASSAGWIRRAYSQSKPRQVQPR